MNKKVLGLGAIAMDVVLKCNQLPKNDGTAFISDEKLIPGGSCANVLVTLSKLGVDTGIIGKVGDDKYSELFVEDLKDNNIDTKYIVVKKDGTMLHTYITVTSNGEKCIFSNCGDSFLDLREEEVSEKCLEDISVFYNDMFLGKPSLKLARICKEKGIPIVFNLQCNLEFMKLCNVSKAEIEEMISLSDIFVSHSEGLFELSGIEDHEKGAKKIFEKYKPKLGVMATCGSKGSLGVIDGNTIFAPSYKVEVVDTTGAGDAFIGGLIYGYYIKDIGIEEALKFANACAAIKCTQIGGRINTDINEVLNLYKNEA